MKTATEIQTETLNLAIEGIINSEKPENWKYVKSNTIDEAWKAALNKIYSIQGRSIRYIAFSIEKDDLNFKTFKNTKSW